MAQRVVKLKPEKPAPAPVIRLRRAAPGEKSVYPFLVGHVDQRGTEDFLSLREFQTYDSALKAAEEYAHGLRIGVEDATGVKPEPKADVPAAKAASAQRAKPFTLTQSKLEELPTLNSLFKLPDINERTSAIDHELLVNRAFALHQEQRDGVLDHLNKAFGDSRSYGVAYTQKVHDQVQSQLQSLYVQSEITKAILYSYLERAFARIDELESKMLTVDDFDAQVGADDRTVELAFGAGADQRVASFKWPCMLYRGVHREGQRYSVGDTITASGSLWHCDKETTSKPPSGDWTMCVKRGRDGKDATR